MTLTIDERARLVSRWAAYALRRGPFVITDNMKKLGALLLFHGVDPSAAGLIASQAAKVATIAWDFEGGTLERAGAALDEVRVQAAAGLVVAQDPRPTAAELRVQLEALIGAAQDALGSLNAAGL